MKKKKNNQILYIEILRIVACFLVIVNHTGGYVLNYKSFTNTTFYCIAFALCKIGVPIFLMITGTLLLDKKYDYKKVFQCIFKIGVPLFVLSFIYYIKDVGISHIDFIGFIRKIITTPYIVPFWYLYALIGLYLAMPFLQKMIKNFEKKDYMYFMLFFVIFPGLLNLLSSYSSMTVSYNIFLSLFPFFIALPVCGNFMSKLELKKKYLIISLITFIISYLGMFSSLYIPFLKSGEVSLKLDGWNVLPVMLMSISFFYIFRYIFENKKIGKKTTKVILTISQTTFGIYLIHSVIVWDIYNISYLRSISEFNAIIGIIVVELCIFIVCFILIYILKKIPVIKKFL